MGDIQSVIVKYRFGWRFRTLLLVLALVLVMFHIIVLFLPFFDLLENEDLEHIRHISDTISGISVALILMILVIEGQRSIRSAIIARRRDDYKNIGNQITRWLERSCSNTFDPNVVNSKTTEEHEVLRNFKVVGSALKIAERDNLDLIQQRILKNYCEKVHYELTTYPGEIIYGIHFEFDDFEINRTIYERLKEELALHRQSCVFQEDNIIPKKPNWIFVTRTVELAGDIDDDFPKVLTHGRHFVEFVCHSYSIVYGEAMVKFFLHQQNKT